MIKPISKEYFDLIQDTRVTVDNFLTDLLNAKEIALFFEPKLRTPIHLTYALASCISFDMNEISKYINNGEAYSVEDVETPAFVIMVIVLVRQKVDMINSLEAFNNIVTNNEAGYRGIVNNVYQIVRSNNPISITEHDSKGSIHPELNLPLLQLLKIHDHPLFDKYKQVLYEFANLIAKADLTVTEDEAEKLRKIYKILNNPLDTTSNSSSTTTLIPDEDESIDDILKEVDQLIGLTSIKNEIKTLINFVTVQKARGEAGLTQSSLSFHMIFTGNPGTGKTTIARFMGRIYKSLGILEKGHLVETDRSGLVGQYVGHTAIKVNELVDSALGGVLFIDEAYTLFNGSQEDYGKEAIATLIKRMEDERNNLIVILAGYTAEMKTLIDSNPGLQSRVNRYFEFPDYTPDELLAIYLKQCEGLELKPNQQAQDKVLNIVESAYTNRDKYFGNARFVRNLFEKTLERQANRLAPVGKLNKFMLSTLLTEDIPNK